MAVAHDSLRMLCINCTLRLHLHSSGCTGPAPTNCSCSRRVCTGSAPAAQTAAHTRPALGISGLCSPPPAHNHACLPATPCLGAFSQRTAIRKPRSSPTPRPPPAKSRARSSRTYPLQGYGGGRVGGARASAASPPNLSSSASRLYRSQAPDFDTRGVHFARYTPGPLLIFLS